MNPSPAKADAGPNPDLGKLPACNNYAEGLLALVAFKDGKSMLRALLAHHYKTWALLMLRQLERWKLEAC